MSHWLEPDYEREQLLLDVEELGRDLLAMNDLYKKVAGERARYQKALERIANHPERNHIEAPDKIAREALA